MSYQDRWQQRLQQRRQQGLYRRRQVVDSAQAAVVETGDRQLINFCSNDYLGLASHPKVIEAFRRAANRYGVGSGASHLVCGHGRLHHQLEEALADFTGREQALVFSSGYQANLGVISALLGPGDKVYQDRLNHASLLDGGLLSRAQFARYRHSDVSHCAQLLTKAGEGEKLLATDSVFSMDGDIAPVPELAALARQHDALLMVDDAHAIGYLGNNGGGSTDYYRLSTADVPILMGTLGKALGTFGAFVAGSEALIEMLVQFARSYIYTTALPPAVAAATLASLELVKTEAWRRERIQDHVKRFRTQALDLGYRLMPSETAIQPILVGTAQQAIELSQRLQQSGIWVSAIRPPTVPEGGSRLRVTLCAHHQDQHLDQLLYALAEARSVVIDADYVDV